jgi:alpha-amylase
MKKLLVFLALISTMLIACEPTTSSSVSSSSSTSSSASSEVVSETIDVYFYNSDSWAGVSVYPFADDAPLLGSWPGVAATDIGNGWWKATLALDVSKKAFNVIFNNNGAGLQNPAVLIEDEVSVYVNIKGNLFASKEAAVADLAFVENTKIYFYNSNNWSPVHAYGWGNGEPFGGWPGIEMTNEGDGWYSVVYAYDAAKAPFNIIITGATDNPRTESYIDDATNVYLTINSNLQYPSKEAAIASLNIEEKTKVYFYNAEAWTNLNAYVYATVDGNNVEPLGGWSGRACVEESDGWWSVEVPLLAGANPFNIIFNGKLGEENKQVDNYIDSNDKVYATLNGVYASKEIAEVGLGIREATKIYFYNSDNWETVYAYVYATVNDKNYEPLGGWSGTLATEDENGWYYVEVALDVDVDKFNIIFNNASGQQTPGYYIESRTNVFATMTALYSSKEAAMAS